MRFLTDHDSALQMILTLVEQDPVTLGIQHEVVNENCGLIGRSSG